MSLIGCCFVFSFSDVQETSKKQRQREGKRPDLQRYQPSAGQTRRRKDSAEGEVQAVSTERAHTSGERGPDPDPKMPGSSPPSSDLKLTSRDCLSRCNSTDDSGSHQHAGRSTVKDSQISCTGTHGSRKARKPDREIYQPGGRRTQGSRDAGSHKGLEQVSKEEVKGGEGDCGKHRSLVEQTEGLHMEDVKEREKELLSLKQEEITKLKE